MAGQGITIIAMLSRQINVGRRANWFSTYKKQPPNFSKFHMQNLKSPSMWEPLDNIIFRFHFVLPQV